MKKKCLLKIEKLRTSGNFLGYTHHHILYSLEILCLTSCFFIYLSEKCLPPRILHALNGFSFSMDCFEMSFQVGISAKGS